ncbi:MAG: hypothetical protein HFG29_02360 [Eubacterium sp.]|nr:hypothetical protein [Eubacterium sp.]
MKCEVFQKNIRDFIFDKIEYSEDLEEFLSHAKECDECREELELYYKIHRGLGDIEPPVESDEPMSAEEELKYIIEYYNEYFKKEKRLGRIGRFAVAGLGLVLIGLAVYVGAINI